MGAFSRRRNRRAKPLASDQPKPLKARRGATVRVDRGQALDVSSAKPTQADLDAILARATRVVVRDLGSRTKKRLLDTERPSDLESLRATLRIRDAGDAHFHDMCLGDFELAFWHGRSRLPGVTLDHGKAVRVQPFVEQAELVASDPILDWLSAHGIPQAREQFEKTQRQLDELERVRQSWRLAAPPAVQSLADDPNRGPSELAAALVREHPDPVERARVLFEWFGTGEGWWQGMEFSDALPEDLLLQMPLEALLEAAQGNSRTEAVLEGAARLFAGWQFAKTRRDDLKRIPKPFKRVLLEHCMKSPHKDRRVRAKQAFK